MDELHLLLRIIDLLTANSTTEIIDYDVEKSVENTSCKQVHINKLINSIRSSGVSFDVRKKKESQWLREFHS